MEHLFEWQNLSIFRLMAHLMFKMNGISQRHTHKSLNAFQVKVEFSCLGLCGRGKRTMKQAGGKPLTDLKKTYTLNSSELFFERLATSFYAVSIP